MDAREAQLWLDAQKLKEKQRLEAEKTIKGTLPRTPMTDEQWRKLKALTKCHFGSATHAKRFVHDMVVLPDGEPITHRQTEYIDTLWHRYRRQHRYELAAPRWIWDFHHEQFIATASDELYMLSEIGHFNDGRYAFIEPYPCDPANDKFTIQFSDAEDRFF